MARPTSDKTAYESALRHLATQRYVLRLYIAGATGFSERALRCVIAVCEDSLSSRYDLEVIDVYQQPERARSDQIVALPTLIRLAPSPVERFVGGLSNRERVLRALGLVVSIEKHAPLTSAKKKPPRR